MDDKYIEYYQSLIDNDIEKKESIQKQVDNYVIPYIDKVYNHYPNHHNDDFIYELSKKLEFFHMKTTMNITDISNRCPTIEGSHFTLSKIRETIHKHPQLSSMIKGIDSATKVVLIKQIKDLGYTIDHEKGEIIKVGPSPFHFELSNNQQFLKNFMNKKTPYRGLVIFHGVGVGKTCSAINISSSFRDIYMSNKEKIICLVPKNIRGGWENTIYDKTKGVDQCSGDSFEDIINTGSMGGISNRKVKNMIRNYYDFYGYLKFANHVKRLIKAVVGKDKLSKDAQEEKEREVIKKNFSNRILIIDEIHNLREENDENNKGDTKIKIKKGSKVTWEDERGVFQYGEIVSLEGEKPNKFYNVRLTGDDSIHKVSVDYIKKTVEEDKKAREIIEKVIEYSDGLRIIMLSATPLFNKSTEIVWLLNLLLKNDKRPLLSYADLFKKTSKGDLLTKKGKEIIKQKSIGYFSYLRGENPISFPIRLYPDVNNDSLCMGGDFNKKIKYLDYPSLSLFINKAGEHIQMRNKYQFRFMKMYNTTMVNYQKEMYEKYIQKIQTFQKKKLSGGLRLSDRNIGLQLSNITYSNDYEDNPLNSYGRKGYDKIFSDKIKGKGKKCSYINKEKPLLDIDTLQDISTKLYTIITNMLKHKPEGIIFIYSDFIYSGILPMALALEHIGFAKYNGSDILDYPSWKSGENTNATKREPIDYQFNKMSDSENKKQAKYIILTGDKSLSPDNELERKASSNEDNVYGENIKVILGNTVTSEGMDFRNIREVHVLDPWYHLYKIEQIIGRGIRYCSHSFQPKEKQNVTVYLHTSSIDNKIESIDTNTYRIAEEKASQIGEIEKILKENAVDCFLNKQVNVINGLKDIYLKTTWKKTIKVDINDKDFTKICSFSGEKEEQNESSPPSSRGNKGCEINCNVSSEKWDKLVKYIKDDSSIDDDTFTISDITESIQLIYKIIQELYAIYSIYTLDEISSRIKELIDTNQKIIYHSMEDIIENKWVVWSNNISGHIIQRGEYYLFQPFHNTDTFIPYIYRNTVNEKEIKKITQPMKELKVDVIDDINCTMDYNDIYEKLKLKFDNIDNDIFKFKPFLSKINPNIFIERYIDSMKYEEKATLLKEILCEYINNGYQPLTDKVDQVIFDFFKNNLITVDDNMEYYILEKDQGVVIGFFLFNTNEYYSNTEKEVLDDFTYHQYTENKWEEIDNVGINSIKANFRKNKKKGSFFKMKTSIWGYSFKDEVENHTFKIIDNPTYDNKVPGKVIGNKGVKPITLLKDFSKDLKEDYKLYIKNIILMIEKKLKSQKKISEFRSKLTDVTMDELIKTVLSEYKNNNVKSQKNIISKEYITQLFEYSLRSIYPFLNYDLFLLKYIS